MIAYKKTTKDSLVELLNLISVFSKIFDTKYKINIQKSVFFLYTSRNSIRLHFKKIAFIFKNIKYLGINLTETAKPVPGNYNTEDPREG